MEEPQDGFLAIILVAGIVILELPELLPDDAEDISSLLREALLVARRLGYGDDWEEAADRLWELMVAEPGLRKRVDVLVPALVEDRGGPPNQGGGFLPGDPIPLPYSRHACTECTWVWPVLDVGDPELPCPRQDLPDVVISLAMGFVQLGVAGVVASQWAVGGLANSLITAQFYLEWQLSGLSPAESLCTAQRWVRETINQEKIEWLWPAHGDPELPTATTRLLWRELVRRPSEGVDFAHPADSAAYSHMAAWLPGPPRGYGHMPAFG
ncbi:CHAT domain-containing protein [Actinacidiphila sp. bgisy160]|uniref:CHAT domain-containing protein n=1 Tax=Actinacidiphila sp. bgisy160 TaxID=3413796 RepID=UPI003D74DAB5